MCRHNYAAGLLPKEAGPGMGLRTERVKQRPLVGLLRKGISAFPEVKSSLPRVLGDSTSIAVFNNAVRAASSPNPVPLVGRILEEDLRE